MTGESTSTSGVGRSLDLSERQRERFEEIKEEWTDEGTPKPSDEHVLDGLLDTKDAVDDGYYSEDTAVLEARLRKLEERDADKSAAINSALQALRNSTRPLDRRAREARRHLAPFALPRDDDSLRADGGSDRRVQKMITGGTHAKGSDTGRVRPSTMGFCPECDGWFLRHRHEHELYDEPQDTVDESGAPDDLTRLEVFQP